jgi:hypothetical protein
VARSTAVTVLDDVVASCRDHGIADADLAALAEAARRLRATLPG